MPNNTDLCTPFKVVIGGCRIQRWRLNSEGTYDQRNDATTYAETLFIFDRKNEQVTIYPVNFSPRHVEFSIHYTENLVVEDRVGTVIPLADFEAFKTYIETTQDTCGCCAGGA